MALRVEFAVQTLACGDTAELLVGRGLPVQVARPDSPPVGPGFVALVVPLHGVVVPRPNPDTELATGPPGRLPERLYVSLGDEVDDAETLPPQIGYEAV